MSAELSSLAATTARRADARSLDVERVFTDGVTHPFDRVGWKRRSARITASDGSVVFEQADIEVPDFWSETATNIVAQKYFHGRLGTPERESSVRALISRVATTLAS